MNSSAKEILNKIETRLKENPSERFAQALFNLGINEFEDKSNPESKGFLLRDIYNDTDKYILDKINKQP
jgi:hypothetical protein